MSDKRFEVSFDEKRIIDIYAVNKNTTEYDIRKSCDLINSLYEENEQLKNELKKVKSLLEYSDSMYDSDLIVNIRFINGEWKADVSVIDNE